MTARFIACLTLASALSVACDRDSQPPLTFPFNVPPPPPSSTPVQLPVPVPKERWNLATTYLGHSGPPACIKPFDGIVRPPIELEIMILRSAESIEMWTRQGDYYVGTIAGDDFVASQSYEEPKETWLCGEQGRFHYRVEEYLSGHFSGDGRALMGEQVALARLESGETITQRWGWSARQID
jgi:hypothetical protein